MEMKPNGTGDTKSLSPSRSRASQKSSSTTSSNTPRRFFGRLFSLSNRQRSKKSKSGTKRTTGLQPDEKKDLLPSTSSSMRATTDSRSERSSRSRSLIDGRSNRSLEDVVIDPFGVNRECFVCFETAVEFGVPLFTQCVHHPCRTCLKTYLMLELDECRLPKCMACSTIIHPLDVQNVLDSSYCEKYDNFSIGRFLRSQSDTRWCPRPDCGFALIANDFASCPKITCHRPGCKTEFCYHCRQYWHPNQSCDQAQIASLLQLRPNRTLLPGTKGSSARRNIVFNYSNFRPVLFPRPATNSFSLPSLSNSDIKQCPRCGALISKMDDGSCNHITCTCGCEFCWLCLKEISDLHYLSPSGCTFWGKQVWSKKKIVIWQIGTLVLAPPMIGLMAGVAIPATIVGVPIWIGRQIRSKLKKNHNLTKKKRRALVGLGSTVALLLSPLVAGITVGVGVPVVLLYVYGVIPITLCRTGGCGVTMPTHTALRFNLRTNNSQNANGAESDKTSNSNQPTATNFNPSSDIRWVEDYSVNQSDDFSVQSVTDHGSPMNHPGDISSTVALASFCSNSINGSAILQSQDNYNSTSASISSKGKCKKIPAIVHEHHRTKTPSLSKSETLEEDRSSLVQKE